MRTTLASYDPKNHVTLVVWTNLPVSPDEAPTANATMCPSQL